MADNREPESPWSSVIIGALVQILGAVLLLMPDAPPRWIVVVVLAFGSTITLIGVVGVGVLTGLRRADYLRSRRD